MKLGLDYVPDVYESSVCEEVFKIVSIEPWFMYFGRVKTYGCYGVNISQNCVCL